MNHSELKIAAFFDGRPGHEKQTLGILKNIQRKCNPDIISVTINKPSFIQQLYDWITFLSFDPGEYVQQLSRCDFFIGTGTHTHLPMLRYKKKFKVPVVTCMTPSSLLMRYFDLVFVPLHDNTASAGNIFYTTGSPNACSDKQAHDSQKILIVLGGIDIKSHIWEYDEIASYVERLVLFDPAKKYVISSSPRTPEQTVLQMISFSEKHENVSFYDYKDTPHGWIEKEYDSCKQVWVTGDSISMVYEALSAGCHVGVIPVKWHNSSSKFVRSVDCLKKNGFVIELEAYLGKSARWGKTEVLNEADRCANEILRRWA